MLNYAAPIAGQKSTIDGNGSDQIRTRFWLRKAIVTARRVQFFSQLAQTTNMPKHFGKHIVAYEYVPLLDDRNTYSQGINAQGVTIAKGNLYGSSKDIGTIVAALPTLTENGGRVNKVGFTRLERQGSLSKLGFFHEFTDESLNFDSDDQLMEHLSRELLSGAVQISEDMLQVDLVNGAGSVVYPGSAISNATVSGEGSGAAVVTAATLARLDRILTDNHTPRDTKIVTGSKFTDTRTIAAARIMYASADIIPHLEKIVDSFGDKMWVPLHKYADAASALVGEVGSVGKFRVIEVPGMLHWAGAGATATSANPGYRSTVVGGTEKYDVYPLLVVGSESFTTIGFQTDGKNMKFNITTKMPGKDQADKNDPYGETGFSSIKWYYGILILRPERIGLIKAVAPE